MPTSIVASKYAFVLLGFVALGMLYPAMFAGTWGRAVWGLSFSLLLVLVVWAACRTPHQRVIGTALATLSIAAEAATVTLSLEGTFWAYTTQAVVFTFLGFATLVVLGEVLEGRRVTLDKIYGAACVYLMIGLAFAVLYQFLDGVVGRGAFSFPLGGPDAEAFTDGGTNTLPTFLYHSFVTLTTLGYGDIVPVSPWARLLSSTESIVGQLYLTILVARLVGLHISQRGVVES